MYVLPCHVINSVTINACSALSSVQAEGLSVTCVYLDMVNAALTQGLCTAYQWEVTWDTRHLYVAEF